MTKNSKHKEENDIGRIMDVLEYRTTCSEKISKTAKTVALNNIYHSMIKKHSMHNKKWYHSPKIW